MKVINSLQGLKDYGFKPLTGEACNLSMRVLTDMTQEACRIFNECFGLPQDSSFEENWNPGSVASVMLSHDAYKSLGVFALLDDGCHTVMQSKDGVLFGLEVGEEYKPENGIVNDKGDWESTSDSEIKLDGEWRPWPTSYGKISRMYGHSSHPHVGTRNTHAMSGRVN